MAPTTRDAVLSAAGLCWGVAMLISWFGPDDGPVRAIGLTAAVAGLAAAGVWLVGWLRARRLSDPTAQVDARVVLGAGLLIALGTGALAERLTTSDAVGYVVFGVVLAGALVAYIRTAQAAWRRDRD